MINRFLRIFSGLLIIACIAAGVYFFIDFGGFSAVLARAAPAPTPEVASAAAESPRRVVATGVVVPVRHGTIHMFADGIIAEVLVKEGDVVEAGQALIRLNDQAQVSDVEHAEAQLAGKQAELALLQAGASAQAITIAEVDVEIAQANLDRMNSTVPNVGMAAQDLTVSTQIAEAELRRAQAELERLQLGPRSQELAVAQAEVAEAEAQLRRMQVALDATVLRAPFAGTVATLDVEAGDQVPAGTVLVELADLTEWQIQLSDLSEYDVIHVQPGDKVSIKIDALSGLMGTGTLQRITPLGVLRAGDVTYSAIVKPDEVDPRLRWNMIAQVTFQPPQ